ncbi:MAG: bifunctional diaminohydroxyphosphoribosylaminopyrimidine deaminase/5-amino-6-(5-phosphoribosylamino)uracil reductase, partial [Deltaproteobacteria bacterium]|nr:bifunctional diaminohydroxyphosphoribosylaminopyrimidine deaminase/5-amino-6-(5-phosphoribosylamino)uracil reductase [Candidatus Tharpella sp.]
MQAALGLARKALGLTAPNPMVGAVVVADGEIVGRGFHPRAGEPHAEVFALNDAGERALNAELFVTLEPCNH